MRLTDQLSPRRKMARGALKIAPVRQASWEVIVADMMVGGREEKARQHLSVAHFPLVCRPHSKRFQRN